MVTQVEFDLKLDQLAADAANERAEVQAALGAAQASNDALAAEVQALKDQLAAGVVVTQAQLDSMAAKADAVSIAIKGVYDAPAAPV